MASSTVLTTLSRSLTAPPWTTSALAVALAMPCLANAAGDTQMASTSSLGQPGNGASYWGNSPSDRYVSGHGRHVAFQSDASNLVAGDTNGFRDVFVHDTLDGATTRVSVSSAGVQGDGSSGMPSISGNGLFVAFESDATNLVAGDFNGLTDVFVRDLAAGTTQIVSVSTLGAPGNGYSARPSISADGAVVAFLSVSMNWVPGKTIPYQDIFARDRIAGTTEWLNPPLSGSPNNNHHSGAPSISDDGQLVAFASRAGGLAPTSFDTTFTSQIYVRDRQTSTTEWISVCVLVSGESSDSFEPSISGDGRYVAYESDSSVVVAGDTNGVRDIFVRDRQTGLAERVNVSSSGAQAVTLGPSVGSGSSHASISREGRYVAFDSYATNLDPSDTLPFNFDDIFVRDRTTGTTTLESRNTAGVIGNSSSENPAIAADGSTVVFASFATNLVANDSNLAPDVFSRVMTPRPPESYCTAGTSTSGCAPTISSAGVPSASAGSGFTLTLSGVDGQKSGLLFYGVSGAIASPWGGGTSFLCVKAPTQRMTTQNSGGVVGSCDGTFGEDWNAYIATHSGALGQPFLGGEMVWAQGWYRDPPAPKTTGLSNALGFGVTP